MNWITWEADIKLQIPSLQSHRPSSNLLTQNHRASEIQLFLKSSEVIQDPPSLGITGLDDYQVPSGAKFYIGLETHSHSFQHLSMCMVRTVCICELEEAECKKQVSGTYLFQVPGAWNLGLR